MGKRGKRAPSQPLRSSRKSNKKHVDDESSAPSGTPAPPRSSRKSNKKHVDDESSAPSGTPAPTAVNAKGKKKHIDESTTKNGNSVNSSSSSPPPPFRLQHDKAPAEETCGQGSDQEATIDKDKNSENNGQDEENIFDEVKKEEEKVERLDDFSPPSYDLDPRIEMLEYPPFPGSDVHLRDRDGRAANENAANAHTTNPDGQEGAVAAATGVVDEENRKKRQVQASNRSDFSKGLDIKVAFTDELPESPAHTAGTDSDALQENRSATRAIQPNGEIPVDVSPPPRGSSPTGDAPRGSSPDRDMSPSANPAEIPNEGRMGRQSVANIKDIFQPRERNPNLGGASSSGVKTVKKEPKAPKQPRAKSRARAQSRAKEEPGASASASGATTPAGGATPRPKRAASRKKKAQVEEEGSFIFTTTTARFIKTAVNYGIMTNNPECYVVPKFDDHQALKTEFTTLPNISIDPTSSSSNEPAGQGCPTGRGASSSLTLEPTSASSATGLSQTHSYTPSQSRAGFTPSQSRAVTPSQGSRGRQSVIKTEEQLEKEARMKLEKERRENMKKVEADMKLGIGLEARYFEFQATNGKSCRECGSKILPRAMRIREINKKKKRNNFYHSACFYKKRLVPEDEIEEDGISRPELGCWTSNWRMEDLLEKLSTKEGQEEQTQYMKTRLDCKLDYERMNMQREARRKRAEGYTSGEESDSGCGYRLVREEQKARGIVNPEQRYAKNIDPWEIIDMHSNVPHPEFFNECFAGLRSQMGANERFPPHMTAHLHMLDTPALRRRFKAFPDDIKKRLLDLEHDFVFEEIMTLDTDVEVIRAIRMRETPELQKLCGVDPRRRKELLAIDDVAERCRLLELEEVKDIKELRSGFPTPSSARAGDRKHSASSAHEKPMAELMAAIKEKQRKVAEDYDYMIKKDDSSNKKPVAAAATLGVSGTDRDKSSVPPQEVSAQSDRDHIAPSSSSSSAPLHAQSDTATWSSRRKSGVSGQTYRDHIAFSSSSLSNPLHTQSDPATSSSKRESGLNAQSDRDHIAGSSSSSSAPLHAQSDRDHIAPSSSSLSAPIHTQSGPATSSSKRESGVSAQSYRDHIAPSSSSSSAPLHAQSDPADSSSKRESGVSAQCYRDHIAPSSSSSSAPLYAQSDTATSSSKRESGISASSSTTPTTLPPGAPQNPAENGDDVKEGNQYAEHYRTRSRLSPCYLLHDAPAIKSEVSRAKRPRTETDALPMSLSNLSSMSVENTHRRASSQDVWEDAPRCVPAAKTSSLKQESEGSGSENGSTLFTGVTGGFAPVRSGADLKSMELSKDTRSKMLFPSKEEFDKVSAKPRANSNNPQQQLWSQFAASEVEQASVGPVASTTARNTAAPPVRTRTRSLSPPMSPRRIENRPTYPDATNARGLITASQRSEESRRGAALAPQETRRGGYADLPSAIRGHATDDSDEESPANEYPKSRGVLGPSANQGGPLRNGTRTTTKGRSAPSSAAATYGFQAGSSSSRPGPAKPTRSDRFRRKTLTPPTPPESEEDAHVTATTTQRRHRKTLSPESYEKQKKKDAKHGKGRKLSVGSHENTPVEEEFASKASGEGRRRVRRVVSRTLSPERDHEAGEEASTPRGTLRNDEEEEKEEEGSVSSPDTSPVDSPSVTPTPRGNRRRLRKTLSPKSYKGQAAPVLTAAPSSGKNVNEMSFCNINQKTSPSSSCHDNSESSSAPSRTPSLRQRVGRTLSPPHDESPPSSESKTPQQQQQQQPQRPNIREKIPRASTLPQSTGNHNSAESISLTSRRGESKKRAHRNHHVDRSGAPTWTSESETDEEIFRPRPPAKKKRGLSMRSVCEREEEPSNADTPIGQEARWTPVQTKSSSSLTAPAPTTRKRELMNATEVKTGLLGTSMSSSSTSLPAAAATSSSSRVVRDNPMIGTTCAERVKLIKSGAYPGRKAKDDRTPPALARSLSLGTDEFMLGEDSQQQQLDGRSNALTQVVNAFGVGNTRPTITTSSSPQGSGTSPVGRTALWPPTPTNNRCEKEPQQPRGISDDDEADKSSEVFNITEEDYESSNEISSCDRRLLTSHGMVVKNDGKKRSRTRSPGSSQEMVQETPELRLQEQLLEEKRKAIEAEQQKEIEALNAKHEAQLKAAVEELEMSKARRRAREELGKRCEEEERDNEESEEAQRGREGEEMTEEEGEGENTTTKRAGARGGEKRKSRTRKTGEIRRRELARRTLGGESKTSNQGEEAMEGGQPPSSSNLSLRAASRGRRSSAATSTNTGSKDQPASAAGPSAAPGRERKRGLSVTSKQEDGPASAASRAGGRGKSVAPAQSKKAPTAARRKTAVAKSKKKEEGRSTGPQEDTNAPGEVASIEGHDAPVIIPWRRHNKVVIERPRSGSRPREEGQFFDVNGFPLLYG